MRRYGYLSSQSVARQGVHQPVVQRDAALRHHGTSNLRCSCSMGTTRANEGYASDPVLTLVRPLKPRVLETTVLSDVVTPMKFGPQRKSQGVFVERGQPHIMLQALLHALESSLRSGWSHEHPLVERCDKSVLYYFGNPVSKKSTPHVVCFFGFRISKIIYY